MRLGNIIIYLLLASLLTYSCTPVRSKRPGSKRSSTARIKHDKPSKKSSSKKTRESGDNFKARFSDTTTIVINPATNAEQYSINDQFDLAVQEFDNENYEQACSKAAYFAETFAFGDSLYYESLFLLSECSIVNEDFDEAEKILKSLAYEKSLLPAIEEKVLVRLGQLYCVKNKPKTARKYFKKLKRKYPHSIYIPLANCESVRVD